MVSVGMSVQRDSSTLLGNSVNPVLQPASSVWQRIVASAAALDTSSKTTSVSLWSAAQVRESTWRKAEYVGEFSIDTMGWLVTYEATV